MTAIVIFIGLGINGNAMYYKHCDNHISKIREKYTNVAERSQLLTQQGGTSFAAAIFLNVAGIAIGLVTIFVAALITAIITYS